MLLLWLGSHFIDALKAGLTDADKKFEGIRNLGLILVATIGAPFVIYRTWVVGRQAKTAEEQKQLAEDRNFSDLFTKAVEQLGADKVVKRHAKTKDGEDAYDEHGVPVMQETTEANIEVRLGAIYALERISKASKKDHIPIMETLCAYIRENAIGGEPDAFPLGELPERGENEALEGYLDLIKTRTENLRDYFSPEKTLGSDIRAALEVIKRRSEDLKTHERDNLYRLDFRRANLQRADLSECDFDGADLRQARLEGANLSDAQMDGANLGGAKMDRVNLFDAKMEGAELSFAKLEGANLNFAKIDGAALNFAYLQGANLIRAHIQGAKLSYVKMQGAKLSYAKMEGTILVATQMEGANLRGALLRGADLNDARMEKADLSGARLKSAMLAMLRIDSVMASIADFTASKGLTPEMLERFFGCAGTKLPDGMEYPDHWHPTELKVHEQKAAYENWLAIRRANRLPPFEKTDG